MRRLRAAARALLPARPDPIRAFYDLPYEARVKAVQDSYSPQSKKQALGDWFTWTDERFDHEILSNFRPYFDVLLGYARTLKPASMLQLGSYTMTESRWLVRDGFPGRIIASDYAPEHIAYLRKGFRGTRFERVELRVLDLEWPKPDDFADVDMIAAIAVLSNIQPEGMERLFTTLAASRVRCMIVGDTYVKRSLGIDAAQANVSHPLSSVRNWCHPYMALAAKHGFEAFFLPDFTYSSYLEARGMFVIHRGIALDVHERALGDAMRNYISRQGRIWPSYVAETYAGLEA
jgi:hypothetical protein